MPALLIANELCKSYVAGYGRCWARVQVLSCLSLTLGIGERVVIAGARGSGKTTLLHCLTGLRRLDAGSVRWNVGAGSPYVRCDEPQQLGAMTRGTTALIELPDDPRAVIRWIEALHAEDSTGVGWLVLSSRLTVLSTIADRALELHAGVLHPVTIRRAHRVAEQLDTAPARWPERVPQAVLGGYGSPDASGA